MKRFARFLACLLAVCIVASALPVLAAQPALTVESKTVDAGAQSVTVSVTLSGNAGLAGLLLAIRYDAALKLTKIEQGSALGTLVFTPGGNLSANPITLLWDGQDADASNGEIARLTFALPAGNGVYTVTPSLRPGDAYDDNLTDVAVTLLDGTITVGAGDQTGPAKPDDPVKPDDPTPAKIRYDDVADTAWYAEAISYVSEKGLMSGTGASRFSPDATMTRAMLMTVLARYAGVDTSGGATWYEKGMNWAKENGISDGTNPTADITREQLVTMLYRYVQKQGGGFTGMWTFLLDYPDRTAVSEWAYEAMCRMTMNKVISGMGDGTLAPQAKATRAQVATILMRFVELG